MLKNLVRAFRLPFLSASVLPFIFGSLILRYDFDLLGFLLGLFAVIATHVSANLMNDYADSKSGADWKDKNFYQFFGGSKLIQENIFSEKFILISAMIAAVIACLCVVFLSLHLQHPIVIIFYFIIIFLSWSYSAKPIQFSYRRCGELLIFILFGPALVMGGYFIQTGIFPDLKSFMLSLPFGFLTTAILFSNEVPDFADDQKAGKKTLVGAWGRERDFLLYYFLSGLAFLSIVVNIFLGYSNAIVLFALGSVILTHKAAMILRKFPSDKMRLTESSRLAILTHVLTSLILIISIFFKSHSGI